MELIEAVREARRLRGTVMVATGRRDRQWCAAVAAVDEAIELRVGPPRRRRRKQWLRDHGFVEVLDAWTRPEASLGDEACAAVLADALEHALGAEPGAPLRHVLTHPGVLEGTEPPPPGAPVAEHVATALRALIREPGLRLDVRCAVPERLWATVWAREEELVVEQELPERAWSRPRTEAGAADVAATLPEPRTPLYLNFIPDPRR
jgi:hypothetical protein